jgi:hypothetical protein
MVSNRVSFGNGFLTFGTWAADQECVKRLERGLSSVSSCSGSRRFAPKHATITALQNFGSPGARTFGPRKKIAHAAIAQTPNTARTSYLLLLTATMTASVAIMLSMAFNGGPRDRGALPGAWEELHGFLHGIYSPNSITAEWGSEIVSSNPCRYLT